MVAGPYIAGETLEEAIDRAKQVYEQNGFESTLDVLGEDVQRWEDVEAYYEEYKRLIDAVGPLEYANISIKLSALGQLLDEDRCVELASDIVKRADELNTFVRLDMEDHTTTDSTLRIYRRLREHSDNCGVVFQSRLFRTEEDIEQLKPLSPNVRLCIGIYREPPSVALQDKPAMKRHMLELLETMWKNGQHVGLATHEEWVIRDALELAERVGKDDVEIEIQMLLGVPRLALQKKLMERGITVRLYVPYGAHWYAYSMRRLENNPDVLQSVTRSMFSSLFGRA